jgi:hypothetical protein
MTPSDIGERAEMAVIAALARTGKSVYLPIGSSGRADLVFEDEQGLHRVQVKNGRLMGDVVYFRTHSNTANRPKDYRGHVEYFGVYCHARREVYLVPVDQVPSRGANLRLRPPRSPQVTGVRWAHDYLLAPDVVPRLFEPDDVAAEPVNRTPAEPQ